MQFRSHPRLAALATLTFGLGLLLAVPTVAGDLADEVIFGISKQQPAEVLASIDKSLLDYQVFDLDTRAIDRRVRRDGRVKIYLGNQGFDLQLVANDMRALGHSRVVMVDGRAVTQAPGPVVTFKGQIVGDPSSRVRLTVMPEFIAGYIRTDEDWIFIDPVSEFHQGSAADGFVIYRDTAVIEAEAGACGTAHRHDVRGHLEALPGGRGDFLSTHRLPGQGGVGDAPEVLQVATECDGQYFADFGNPGVFNRITGILNDVEGIYEDEINTTISITNQQCWSSIPNDPYTSLNAETSLNQFRDWWNANKGGTVRDVAHKFSGKNFSGSTIGIAWVGVICNVPSLSYGISQDISGSASRRRLTAHEIGHNLSARHDNQAPVCSGVNCNGNGPIMCSFVQSGSSSAADNFSSCSRNSINNHIAQFGSCL